MANKRRGNFLGQQRLDVSHVKAVESAVSNDFDELLNCLVIGEGKSYVVRGFTISMPGAIGSSASGLQLLVADSAFLHGNSDKSGTYYVVPSGTPAEVLSSTTNTKVEGAFTPSTDNYIGIEFVREVDDTTTDQVPFWNPTTNIEVTKTVPLAITLDYKIVISTSSFASNVLPIAIVQTDASNNVIEVTDRRALLYRLASAGASEPDPFYEYPWTDGRAENFYKSTSSASDPFFGGDKQISNMKEFFDALMTEIKLFKGTPYWYSPGTGGSISRLRQDVANTTITGKGNVSHDAVTSGLINWSQNFYINFIGGRLRYQITANPATSDITLADNQVCYVNLIRGVNITPNLVFTNGGAVVSSVGAVDWTTDLLPGDFVKNAAEGDEKYYEILSVDSLSQVTLTENFQEASSGASGFNAQYAFGSYETNATPSTDRHLRVADRGSVPFGQDYFWLFSRQDDTSSVPYIYVRALGNGELEKGEEREISDNTSADVLTYIGSTSESDQDPAYATLATGAKTGTENYNSVQGENLTVRLSKLTSMMSDKAQDRNIRILSDHERVKNVIDTTFQRVTFVGGSASADVIVPGSADNGTIGLSGTLSLEANKAAYFSVDRNAAFSVANLAALTVVDITALPINENVFVFAYRLADNKVYLWDGSVIEGFSVNDREIPSHVGLVNDVRINKNLKMIGGGTWSWDLGTNTLANSASAYLQIPEITTVSNEISAQSIVLSADGECAYVRAKKSSGASTRTVVVADIASILQENDIYIIARRVGNDVIVGSSSFAMKDGEFLELDGALAEINRYHGQLAVRPLATITDRVRISGSDIAKLSGSQLSLEQKNLILSMEEVVIDFGTGNVFESDGSTPFNGGANDFTPQTIPANEYFWYSISVLPNTTNADNTISGQILVIPATATNVVLANAPKAPFPSSGIKLCNVYVQRNAGDTALENIDYANIIQLGVGGSGGGSGDANADLTRYQDRLQLAPFQYANTNIASVDETGQLDGSSTATYDIPSGNFKFADSTAQILLSTQQLDADFLAEESDLTTVELYTIWDLDNIDTGATYEISRDGTNFQTLTASRIGNSDAYRALHTFTDEPSNAFNQEYAVANADSVKDFNDSTQQEISQKFTVAATTVYKDIILYINKNTASATGRYVAEIVRDDTGAPSTDVNDIVWTSPSQNIDSLATGNNVVTISSQFAMVAGDYHLIVRPDDAYRTQYGVSASDKISLRMDSSSGPTPNLRLHNGTSWGAEVANETAVYRLEGRVLDLRVRITSAATAGDKYLSSYGIYYKFEDHIEYTKPVFREIFKFDGTVDNDNEFTLTNFLPDSRLLMVFALGTGQIFRYGDFVLDGHKVIFPENTFNVVGDVELEMLQIQAVDGVASNVADALLTANFLGSTDAGIDKSVAGRGIILRNQNGDLVEVGLDASNNWTYTLL